MASVIFTAIQIQTQMASATFVDADEDGVCDHCHDHGKPVPAETTLDGAAGTAAVPSTAAVTYAAPAPTVTYTAPAVTYDANYYYGCHGSRHHRSGHHGHCW